MCGISGIIDFKKKSSESILSEMNNTLIHRGPDGFGTQFFEKENYQLGLGHRRLSILELSELGKQPKNFQNLWITFNGEIYNYKEINIELEKIGYTIESNSDTETILKSYHAWGEKCLDKFIGMFAFVIYNEENDELFIVRDRTGIKPLYLYQNEDIVLFASELKAFHKHPSFQKEIDFNAVGLYIQYGSVPSNHCIFKNCKKILPGNFIKTDLKKLNLSQKSYWNVYDFYNQGTLDISFEEAKLKTLEIIQSASNYRMVSDVPVGIFLSGGYDSSCLTAVLQKNQKSLNTFTIAVPDIGMDESKYAKQIADYLGTNHTEAECSEKEAINIIKELPYFFDEPFSDASAIPTILVSQLAKNQVTVVLSADGGDEVFAGYSRYSDYMKFINKYDKKPKSLLYLLNKMAGAPIIKSLLKLKIQNFENRKEKLDEVLHDYSIEHAYALFHKQYSDKQIQDILKHKVSLNDTFYNEKQLKKEFFNPLKFAMTIDYKTYLVDDILTKVDRATMSASIEGREPLLDHRLLEFVAQLPDTFKFHNGTKKYILKEIVHDFIPKSLMDRPKMGFSIPISKWLKTDLKEYVENYMNDTKIENQKIFDTDFIKKIKYDFYSKNKNELGPRIWNILMFQMWYEKWV